MQVCCVRRALLFRSSIWHCTARNVLLKLDASHHPVIGLRILEANCLSNRTSATVEVVKAWCHYRSSKLCLLFDLFCCSNLYTPGSCKHSQPCRCISSSAMNRLGQRRPHDAAWCLGGIRVLHRSPFDFPGDTTAVCWSPLLIGPMGADCPVCIPSAILCAKLLDVVPLWCFPCLPWRVQLVEVHWPYPTRPTRTATAWSPAGIFVQWSGGYRSEDNDADDGFWNPLRAWACAFARLLLHSSPLWEGWSLGISLHQLLGDHVLMWVFWSFVPRRLWTRSGFLLVSTGVVKCTFPYRRNT